MREDSDHQQITVNFYGNSDLRPPTAHNKRLLANLEVRQARRLKWSKVDTKAISSFMNSERAQTWVKMIVTSTQDPNRTFTGYANPSSKLRNFLIDKLPARNQQPIRSNWFDLDCSCSRKTLRAAMHLVQRNPTPNNHAKMLKLRRNYKNLTATKKAQHTATVWSGLEKSARVQLSHILEYRIWHAKGA